MTIFKRFYPIVSILLFATTGKPVRADVTPYLPTKTVINIAEFNLELRMYEIKSPEFHGYGRLFVTLDELVKGVPTLRQDRLLRDPGSIVSNEYQLDKDIDIMDITMESDLKEKANAPVTKTRAVTRAKRQERVS